VLSVDTHGALLLRYFNPMQSECFDVACSSDTNMVGYTVQQSGNAHISKRRALQAVERILYCA
jgi:hypothetical protein